MPAKTYTILFDNNFSQKERGALYKRLKEDGIACYADIVSESSYVFPAIPVAPQIRSIRVVDEYRTFEKLYKDNLTDGCKIV